MKLKKFNFKTINSTNDRAFQIIKKTKNKSGIVIAEKQEKRKRSIWEKMDLIQGKFIC